MHFYNFLTNFMFFLQFFYELQIFLAVFIIILWIWIKYLVLLILIFKEFVFEWKVKKKPFRRVFSASLKRIIHKTERRYNIQ